MKKMMLIFPVIAAVATFLMMNFLQLGPTKESKAATDTVTLTTTVLQYLAFSITSGDPVAFGNLTPGSPIAAPTTGTVASVTTNAANGYTIGLSDGISGSDASMVHADTSTHLPDYAGTIASPTTWTGTGLGITLFSADNAKNTTTWGTGTTYNDSNNKYAGIPETATTAHTVTGFHEAADTSTWGFKIDVPNTQKTGAYSGAVTFTATAVLS